MKRLKYIHTDELVTGIVIESYGETGYAMRHYRMNENHEILTIDHLTVLLDMGEIVDIFSRKLSTFQQISLMRLTIIEKIMMFSKN